MAIEQNDLIRFITSDLCGMAQANRNAIAWPTAAASLGQAQYSEKRETPFGAPPV